MSEIDRQRYEDRAAGVEAVPPPRTDRAEREEQRQFANYCLLKRYPFYWHSTAHRTKATPGVPDFIVWVNRSVLAIEFKRDWTCRLSEAQEQFRQLLAAQGFMLNVVYSCGEAIKLCEDADRII